jgi:hypothetical protein
LEDQPMIEHDSTTNDSSAIPQPGAVVPLAVVVSPERMQADRLRANGDALCPWCDGQGERVTRFGQGRLEKFRLIEGPIDRVVCRPCDGTGEADRWQGPAADDWRERIKTPRPAPPRPAPTLSSWPAHPFYARLRELDCIYCIYCAPCGAYLYPDHIHVDAAPPRQTGGDDKAAW